MRRSKRWLLTSLALAAIAPAALAQDANRQAAPQNTAPPGVAPPAFAPATPAAAAALAPPTTAAPAPAMVAPPPDPVALALGEALARSAPASSRPMERAWHDAITAFYAARQNKPMWVTSAGLSDGAGAVMAEISHADDWGLDPKAFRLPAVPTSGADAATLAQAEVTLTNAVVLYAWHAHGGRVDPSQLSRWLDQSPRPVDVKALLTSLAGGSDPAKALLDVHPKQPQFVLLRQAYLKARADAGKVPEDPTAVTIQKGPRIRVGERHPDVLLVRKRLSLPAADERDGEVYDEKLAEAVGRFIGAKPRRVRGHRGTVPARPSLDNQIRAELSRKKKMPDGKAMLRKFLVNLERWRWMPRSLGALYVWNNLPEFQTRVVRNGEVVFQERIIVGKPDTQTPVFSDTMRFVVFHPDWGVPNSIKVKDLLPSLQAGDDSVLYRRNMRILGAGRRGDPASIDWETTDIRKVAIVQDPGPDNPLGQVKFMFPNKHDVYMHDTPTKGLFNSSTRTFSSGCIRVRNPRRLAELVFAIDRGWGAGEISDLVSSRGKDNNRIDLNHPISVHNTYFTLRVDADGAVHSFADIYGHDKRIAAVLLDGQSVEKVAQSDPALALERKVKQLAEAPPRSRRYRDDDGWGGGYFGYGWGPPPQQRRGRNPPPPDGFADFFSGIFGN